METQTQGAAQTGAQGSAAAAGGAAATQQGTGQQGAGQQQTGAQQQGAQGQDAGKNTDQGKADAGDKSQAKPGPFVPKLPDGFKLGEENLKEFNSIFDDANLSTAGKQQKLVDLQVKIWQAEQRAFQDALAAAPAKDLEELKTDKAFGGPNFQATVDGAKRIERLAFGDDLAKLLTPYGLQNSPVVIKGLARMARLIADDSVGTNTGSNGSDADAEMKAMFPKSYDQMKQHARK